MTEKLPLYRAISSLPAQASHERQHSRVSALVQHSIDGSTSCDTILLLPILESPLSSDQPARCLHLIHLPDGTLSFCNHMTTHTCVCCGCPMCERHQSSRWISLADVQSIWQESYRAFLCETCAMLPGQTIHALRAFRLLVNQQQEAHTWKRVAFLMGETDEPYPN